MASFSTFFHGRMTGVEITCMRSFLDHGHQLHVYAFGDCGAPAQLRIEDASKIVPADRLFFYKQGFGAGSPAGFSNYFRYSLLEQVDTIWVDSDVLCLTGDWHRQPLAVLAAWEDTDHINGAVLRLPPHVASICRAEADKLGQDIGWGQSGPFLLTRLLSELELLPAVLPPTTFYPVHFREWYKSFMPQFEPEVTARCNSSSAIHLWNSMMKYTNFDNTLLPEEDSFFGQAVVRHGTARHFKPRDKESYRSHLAACRAVELPG